MSDSPTYTRKDVVVHVLKVLGILTVLTLFTIAMFWRPFSSATGNVDSDLCQDNLVSLVIAAKKYASEHNGMLPGENWDSELARYVSSDLVLACPRQRRLNPDSSGYAMNAACAGKKLADLPPKTILFFDSKDVGVGLIADPSESPRPGRHMTGKANNVVYVNGSAASVPAR